MKNTVIIIDNGHGVDTAGKCSPDKSLYEWHWTREIAARLHEQLSLCGIESILLVPEEQDVPLSERVQRANQIHRQAKAANKECALISVHINAASNGGWKSASGWSGWVSENSSANSKRLAQLLYEQAKHYNLKGNRSVPKERYWTANFYILKNTTMPAVLTENLFQDNKDDVAFLLSEHGKQTIVDLHLNAVKKYIETC